MYFLLLINISDMRFLLVSCESDLTKPIEVPEAIIVQKSANSTRKPAKQRVKSTISAVKSQAKPKKKQFSRSIVQNGHSRYK